MRIYPELLVDQEFKSLGDQGFMGTLNDRQFAFLRSKGYVNALPDMMTSWLAFSFTPSSLFAASEPGIWLDPSDLTTMFQDRAGSTAVTTPGQSVGLRLDKSKGLVLGSEAVINGTFDANSSADWTLNTWTVANNRLEKTSGDNLRASGTLTSALVSGRYYRVTLEASNFATACNVFFRTGEGGTSNAGYSIPSGTAAHSFVMQATDAHTVIQFFPASTSFSGSIDNISVKELPGNHAVANSDAARGIYGIEPLGGRRNLLTFTEQFDNAAWAPITSGPSITKAAAEITFPATTTSGSIAVVRQAFTSIVSNYTGSVELKAKAAGDVGKRIGVWLNDGSVVNFTWHTLTADWVRVTVTESMSAASSFMTIGVLGDTAVGGVIQGAVTVEIRNAQLETGSTATAYQKVTTQYDVTEAGKQTLHYVQYDGSDDGYVTPTITPGIDKVQVFAGVRKLSTAVGVLLETSVSLDTNNGTISFAAPVNSSVHYAYTSKGTTLQGASTTNAIYLAPVTNVVSGLSDISGDLATLRVNGAQVAQATADQGTGNYLAYPLYIGRRGGTTLPFNGRDYGICVRFGANLDASTISATENYMAQKTGVTL